MEECKSSTSKTTDILASRKVLDEVTCPICMDHPHNAVLLICSSHEKGCRSYICDTSYRHSNCLDQFKRYKVNNDDISPNSNTLVQENFSSEQNDQIVDQTVASEPSLSNSRITRISDDNPQEFPPMAEAIDEIGSSQQDRFAATETNETINHEGHSEGNGKEYHSLKCPLCRGTVFGWMIVKEAREYMDLKSRTCSRESCSFYGNYRELRRHARRVHPTTRPADIDPSRRRAWRRLQIQQEHGDILSAIRSAMPGAIVLGDYVIDYGDASPREHEFAEGGGSWLTTFFLLHMFNSSPIRSLDEPRRSSRTWRRHRRSSGRRYLWGENLLGLQDDDDLDMSLDADVMIPRRRRRLTRSSSSEQQP
ncbi:hypothetical protein AXF42_Ash001305 [Apostasia shenzhenica]|uniref:Uncharacterized protein n=1 Tax=Apostasia shenzhenica TaxID=1088818 RepID=A0A2I0AUK5_9ASPA|nr:hypothetical protein AXF42_Ash001305 [Apostasia shenzhenica]